MLNYYLYSLFYVEEKATGQTVDNFFRIFKPFLHRTFGTKNILLPQ